jgi:hypothetical protein
MKQVIEREPLTVVHAITGKRVSPMPAREHKPGKWCVVSCSICGQACFCDLDDAMKSAQAHPACIESLVKA